MYPVMSLLMIGVGIFFVFYAKKVSKKKIGVAGNCGSFGNIYDRGRTGSPVVSDDRTDRPAAGVGGLSASKPRING